MTFNVTVDNKLLNYAYTQATKLLGANEFVFLKRANKNLFLEVEKDSGFASLFVSEIPEGKGDFICIEAASLRPLLKKAGKLTLEKSKNMVTFKIGNVSGRLVSLDHPLPVIKKPKKESMELSNFDYLKRSIDHLHIRDFHFNKPLNIICKKEKDLTYLYSHSEFHLAALEMKEPSDEFCIPYSILKNLSAYEDSPRITITSSAIHAYTEVDYIIFPLESENMESQSLIDVLNKFKKTSPLAKIPALELRENLSYLTGFLSKSVRFDMLENKLNMSVDDSKGTVNTSMKIRNKKKFSFGLRLEMLRDFADICGDSLYLHANKNIIMFKTKKEEGTLYLIGVCE